ncbi:MAG TPA: hypothetical protein VGF65_06790 [Mycobacterium sp.]
MPRGRVGPSFLFCPGQGEERCVGEPLDGGVNERLVRDRVACVVEVESLPGEAGAVVTGGTGSSINLVRNATTLSTGSLIPPTVVECQYAGSVP